MSKLKLNTASGSVTLIPENGTGDVDVIIPRDGFISPLNNKVDKVAGKELSTNDFTNEFKTLLETKKVKNVTTNTTTDRLVITYTDDTTADLNITDIISDTYVNESELNNGLNTKEPAFDILPIAKGGTGNNSGTTYTTDGNVLRVTNPKGGTYTIDSANVTGAIKITLPQSWTDTMMKFTVEVYNNAAQKSFTAEIAGHTCTDASWLSTSAHIISGDNANYAVRFGHDGTKCCVYIGETSSTWVYPKIVITDFQAGYLNFEPSKWIAGWSIEFTDTLGTITSTLTDVQVLNNTSFATQAEVDAGTVTNKAITPATLKDVCVGINTGYIDVTANRFANTIYTADTNMFVLVRTGTAAQSNFYVNDVVICCTETGVGGQYTVGGFVPKGATYKCDRDYKWFELR